jgi:hypothetical protein
VVMPGVMAEPSFAAVVMPILSTMPLATSPV